MARTAIKYGKAWNTNKVSWILKAWIYFTLLVYSEDSNSKDWIELLILKPSCLEGWSNGHCNARERFRGSAKWYKAIWTIPLCMKALASSLVKALPGVRFSIMSFGTISFWKISESQESLGKMWVKSIFTFRLWASTTTYLFSFGT